MMKKFRPLFFLFLMFTSILTLNAQSYSGKQLYSTLGRWEMPIRSEVVGNAQLPVDTMIIISFVTKQGISEFPILQQKTVSELPKYRYELMLYSKSTINNKVSEIGLTGIKVFINGVEATREQFPNGFTMKISTEPTLVYFKETSDDKIDIKISWAGVEYSKNQH
jgi:hypothetical protein